MTTRGCKMLEQGKRHAVFSIRKIKEGSIWVRAGSAFVNQDGSMNIYLDVLPLDGTLHVREHREGSKGAAVVEFSSTKAKVEKGRAS